MKNQANLVYEHQKTRPVGPSRLMTLISNIGSVSTDPEIQHKLLKSILKDWYVECAVTGDKISLDQLKYWNVEKQEAYLSPEVMPLWDRYERIDREEFLKEIEDRLGPKKERAFFVSEKYGKIIC